MIKKFTKKKYKIEGIYTENGIWEVTFNNEKIIVNEEDLRRRLFDENETLENILRMLNFDFE